MGWKEQTGARLFTGCFFPFQLSCVNISVGIESRGGLWQDLGAELTLYTLCYYNTLLFTL